MVTARTWPNAALVKVYKSVTWGLPPCGLYLPAVKWSRKGGDGLGMKIKINKSALDKVVKDAAVAKATEMTYDIACPHCHAAINVPVGKSVCPACGSEIDLKLKFD